jgi:phosphoglycerate dehydrogenase-like enzyme
MGMRSNKVILCDWVDNLSHYNLPAGYFGQLQAICDKGGYSLELSNESIRKTREDVVACLGNKFDENAADFMPNLRWIHFGSIGTDKVTNAYSRRRRLLITNSRGIFEKTVARHVLFLILHSIINLPNIEQEFSRLNWALLNKYSWKKIRVYLLGSGPIATQLEIMLAAVGLDARIVFRDVKKELDQNLFTHADIHVTDNELLCLVNLLPKNSNERFLNSEYFAKFKKVFLYVNAGRHETEDLSTIVQLLRDGKLDRAAWDVLRNEATVQSLRNEFGHRVLFTPHIASFNDDHWDPLMKLVKSNLVAFLTEDYKNMRNICYG